MPALTACAFCGRENEPAARYCLDCGKPMTASAAQAATSSSGSTAERLSAAARPGAQPAPGVPASEPAKPAAAQRPGAPPGPGARPCPRCARVVEAEYVYCGRCGTRVLPLVGNDGTRIALLDEHGAVKEQFALARGEAVVGRGEADIRLDDAFLSPLHARFELRGGELWVRDLGSRNGTWLYIEEPRVLNDGELLLVGSQLLRFRRLGYPGPRASDPDATRRMGSLIPSADVAVLEQLRSDASVRDTFHLSPARDIHIGRDTGDWLFPYDLTMSGRHAQIRSQDADFFVRDCDSKNGVAMAVRGERAVRAGQRVLVGDRILRIESATT